MAIDTRKVVRRPLRFNSLDDMLAEAQRIAAADSARRLTRLGNWTAGQNFAHIAAFIDYCYDGYPPEFSNPPWYVKLAMRLMRKRFLEKGMPQGVRIPGIPAGTTGADDIPTDEGLRRLAKAVARLKTDAPRHPSPALGPMSREDGIKLTLRHAELHFGFLKP